VTAAGVTAVRVTAVGVTAAGVIAVGVIAMGVIAVGVIAMGVIAIRVKLKDFEDILRVIAVGVLKWLIAIRPNSRACSKLSSKTGLQNWPLKLAS
jgi:hypothetical protein